MYFAYDTSGSPIDGLSRLETQYNYRFQQEYTYRNVATNQTTSQISNIAYTKRDGGPSFSDFNLGYTYDALGNIKTITNSANTADNRTYTYDVQGQMLTEKIGNNTYTYTYDTYGNIRTKTEPDGTVHTYEYGNSQWLDLLTKYDGNTIAYDEVGNPTSYNNGKDWWAFLWSNGRQLDTAFSENQTVTYTYDMDGIRDSKTVNGVTYNYITQNGKVVRQTWGNNTLDIIYDTNGNPYSFRYNNAYYVYVLNLQGDVIRIINTNGATVAEYQYDAWGNVIYSTGSMASINPIRYRGYYYDAETGFYYLQSRYYDPSIGRFINADSFASTGQDFIGYNMFAYCNNNPIIHEDNTGHSLRPTTVAICDGGCGYRDVTREITVALTRAAAHARTLRIAYENDLLSGSFAIKDIYIEFKDLVDHYAPWDIKRQEPWELTIGTTYPGYDAEVKFCGLDMTPEYLGNFTYGYLGYAYGIPHVVLLLGSWYAADFPMWGDNLSYELNDWKYITMGYHLAAHGYLEGVDA